MVIALRGGGRLADTMTGTNWGPDSERDQESPEDTTGEGGV